MKSFSAPVTSMSDYTIYSLSGIRLIAAESIQAEDDARALSAAAKLQAGTKREVWDGDRLVGKIELDSGRTAKR